MAIPYNRNLLPGVSWYSALIVMGILCAILLAEKEERRRKLPKDTIIDLALWALRKRQTRPGNLFAWYLLIYGSGRFIIEQLRQDSLYVGSLRASQWLSLVFCVIAAGWLLWGCYGKKRRKLWLSLLPALLLTARWFLLNAPLWYGLVLLLGLAAGFASLAPLKGSGRFLWLLPLVLDLAGLALCAAFPASFFLHLHTALCSATLPLYVGWLSGPSFSPKENAAKETEPCPPET